MFRKVSHTDELYSFSSKVESPKTTKDTKDSAVGGLSLALRGLRNNLSPYHNKGDKSARSITTLSAISTKVNGKKLINQYIILKTVGKGKFSKVAQCMD